MTGQMLVERLVVALGVGALFLPSASDAQVPQSATRTVSLAEAIRLAERVQPPVAQAQAERRTAGARVRNAWGAFLPRISGSTSGSDFFSEGPSRTNPTTGQVTQGNKSERSISAGLSASVDLFTGFRRGADLRAARMSNDAADASVTDARSQQALVTTNQFFDALAANQLVRVREASLRRAEEQLKVSIAKLHAGSATRSDSLRSLVTVGSAQLDLIQAQADLVTAEAGLARLIGEAGRVGAADDSAFYRVLPGFDTTALRREITERSPQVQSAVATAAAARAALRASQAAYWPTLTLSGNTAWDGSQADDYNLLNQRTISLTLRWDIFNGFDRELAITQEAASLDLAEVKAADTKRAVAADLTSQLAALAAAQAGIDITQTSVTAAEEDLRVQQERYRLGASTIVDLLTSHEALTRAEVNVVVARFDYLRANARLAALIGRTL